MPLPKHIHIFDMLNFIDKRADLGYVAASMEVQLEEFKKRNANVDTNDAQKRIQIISDEILFMAKVEQELRTTQRVNMDYVLANLHLSREIEDLKKEIEKLNRQLQGL